MRRIVVLLAAVVLTIPPVESSLAAAEPPPSACVAPASGLTGWWSGDRTASDGWGDNDAQLVGGAKYGSGYVGPAFVLNGSSAFVAVPTAPALNPTSGVMTLSLWVRFNDTSGEQVLAEKWIQVFEQESTGWTLTKHDDNSIGFYSPIGGLHSVPVPIALGRWYNVAVRLDGTTATLFLDGLVIDEQGMDASNALALGTTSSLKFGHRGNPDDTPGSEDESGFYLNGAIDEVLYWNDTALDNGQIGLLVAAGTAGMCGKGGPTARTLQLGNNRPFDHPSLVPTAGMADTGVGTAIGSFSSPFDPDMLYPVGFRWVHLTNTDTLNWQSVEQTPGVYTIDPSADATISDYAANRMTIVLTLGIGEADNPVYGQHLQNAEEIARYAEYVRFMVGHFKDRVRYFELWNEPDIAVSLGNYVAMVRAVVPIIRTEAPAAKIVIGAVAGSGQRDYPGYGPYIRYALHTDWLFGLVDSGVLPLVDAISWHPLYGDRADDPYYQDYPDLVRQIEVATTTAGFDGEYQAGEMHWTTPLQPGYEWEQPVSGAASTNYLMRTTVTHRGLGVVAILAPCGGDDMRAIRNTNVLLAGAKPTSTPIAVTTSATHVRQYSFALPNGDRLVALWNDWLPVDEDPGVAATVTIDLKHVAVTAIDAVHGTSQALMTSASGGGIVIKGLLIKDYPIFLQISAK